MAKKMQINEFKYTELPNGKIEINSCKYIGRFINIPCNINGKEVVGIESKIAFKGVFEKANTVEQVYLPSTLKYIGYAAFADCFNMRIVNIPDSVISIGKYAFVNCKNMERVQLPLLLKNISKTAFWSCEKLTSVTIPQGLKRIGRGAFGNCFKLDNIVLPESLSYINDYVFFSCKNLKNIILPESLVGIGEKAFAFCENIESIKIPKTLCYIGNYAFYNCIRLHDIVLPGELKNIGDNVFGNCHAIVEFDLPGMCQIQGQVVILAQVLNKYGIHARPSIIISEVAKTYNSSIYFYTKRGCADCRKPMAIIALKLKKNEYVRIQATGADAKKAVSNLLILFFDKFGEE